MKIDVYSPTIRRKEMDAVLTAMVEEKIGPGERSRFLIQTAKEHIRFDSALALRSPAVALHLALKSLDVKVGQAVIISALSPVYYIHVIKDLQLIPLFCDVSFDIPCMNINTIEKTIAATSLNICAVVMHHTQGFVPDTEGLERFGIPVIEDISQSYGSWYKTGETSDSRQPDKEELVVKFYGKFCILGLEERDMLTSGGGALLFAMNRRDGVLLRNFSGIPDEYNLPDINASLAIAQFKDVRKNIEKRRGITRIYTQSSLSLATRTKHKSFIFPDEDEYNGFSFSLILDTGLKDVISYARKKDIIVESAFDKTLAGAGLCEQCTVSNSLALRTVLFPIYPRLQPEQVERVSRLIMTLP
jgi:dTDP-4-amino-4,6-dideoxygalactose transaminase